ncbi:MAG: YfiH family protein [Myxococcota bacterium]|jgi:YfiH family protein
MKPTLPLLRGCEPCPSGVSYAFTTRLGGVSVGPVASLNLARTPTDTDEAVGENWRRVAAAMQVGVEQIALLTQIHGVDVARVVAGGGPLDVVAVADAAVCTEPGVLLTIRVADCVPVLLYALGGVAVAHAGWRGAAGDIVTKTAQALAEATEQPVESIRAWVGPCIAVESYETGPEVVDALASSGIDRPIAAPPGPWEREHADVRAVVDAQLRRLGIAVEHIERDTATDDSLFSYRGDNGVTGRLAGVIVLRA